MVLVPAATPVTTPVVESTVATPSVPLVQVPPEVVLEKAVVFPTQTVVVPAIVCAIAALTVTVSEAVFTQPPAVVTL